MAPSTTLALQCVSSGCGTLIGQSLGQTVPETLAGGLLQCVVGAFLMAPGGHRRRRVLKGTNTEVRRGSTVEVSIGCGLCDDCSG